MPSRVHDGMFFALPQSPQLFKQLLMVAGFDRYYQIVKVLPRRGPARDRQPEFTQIDIETSFLTEEEIRTMFEGMIRSTFKHAIGVELPAFPVMKYADAMRLYGSDKPDLRVKLEFTRRHRRHEGRRLQGLLRPGQRGGRPRRRAARARRRRDEPGEIDIYTEFVKIYGAKGLAWIKVNDVAKGREGLQSPIVKNLHDAALKTVLERTGAANGDLIFFGADKAKIVNDAIGACASRSATASSARRAAGARAVGAAVGGRLPDVRVRRRRAALERGAPPFTSPKDGHEDWPSNPRRIAKAYDVVLNGIELGGGSVRIHREEVQSKVFRALKIDAEEAQPFGFLLDALKYGAPPHGGIAIGLDRFVMLMTGAEPARRDRLPEDAACAVPA